MKGIVGAAIVAFSQRRPHQVLLGLRNKEEGFGLWVLPGGKIGADENPVDAVKRETLEEVGVTLNNVTPVYHEWLPDCGEAGCLMLYYAELIDPEVPQIVAEHEFSELAWFDCFALPSNMWASDRRAVQAAVTMEIDE